MFYFGGAKKCPGLALSMHSTIFSMKSERSFLKALSSSQMLNYLLNNCIHSKILFVMELMQYKGQRFISFFMKGLKAENPILQV